MPGRLGAGVHRPGQIGPDRAWLSYSWRRHVEHEVDRGAGDNRDTGKTLLGRQQLILRARQAVGRGSSSAARPPAPRVRRGVVAVAGGGRRALHEPPARPCQGDGLREVRREGRPGRRGCFTRSRRLSRGHRRRHFNCFQHVARTGGTCPGSIAEGCRRTPRDRREGPQRLRPPRRPPIRPGDRGYRMPCSFPGSTQSSRDRDVPASGPRPRNAGPPGVGFRLRGSLR